MCVCGRCSILPKIITVDLVDQMIIITAVVGDDDDQINTLDDHHIAAGIFVF